MDEDKYQLEFSELYQGKMHDVSGREKKAMKILSVLEDHLGGKTNEMTLLDIGCSTGIMTSLISRHFKTAQGIDIDEPGVKFARENFASDNLTFSIQDSMDMDIESNSIDVATCNQVYEHVPKASRLFSEIHRVLRPGGICYFGAPNRLQFMEPHYHLPLLSVIPKPLAHLYLRILRKGDFYYEMHYSYWGLKKLAERFEIYDYTQKIVESPEKFNAEDVVRAGSFAQKGALLLLKTAYWLFPAYVWVLKKKTC
jgi:2-polyprenyl-3-methyl-5-hydroxy-6-metoxy-1,4-benzoquinol methylase